MALSAGEADPAPGDHALSDHDGPFKLVVEGDRRPARSARGLVRLELKPVE